MSNYDDDDLNIYANVGKAILVALFGGGCLLAGNAANKNHLEKELAEVRHKIQTLQNEPLGRIINMEKINQLKAREAELEKKLKKS